MAITKAALTLDHAASLLSKGVEEQLRTMIEAKLKEILRESLSQANLDGAVRDAAAQAANAIKGRLAIYSDVSSDKIVLHVSFDREPLPQAPDHV